MAGSQTLLSPTVLATVCGLGRDGADRKLKWIELRWIGTGNDALDQHNRHKLLRDSASYPVFVSSQFGEDQNES